MSFLARARFSQMRRCSGNWRRSELILCRVNGLNRSTCAKLVSSNNLRRASFLPFDCMRNSFSCWAEVDLDALRGNLAWIRHRVGPHVKILTVVKADAYGHGLKQIAALLMQSGTDIFGVANLSEAQTIRSVGQGWPVLMLGACLPEEVEAAVRDDVMPTISSFEEARAFNDAASQRRKRALVHIKVDTGMGRLGVASDRAGELVEQVAALPHITINGLYTHYSSAEDDRDFSRAQAEQFRGVVGELKRKKLSPPLIHASNSAGL